MSTQKGFTLIEIAIVLVIIGLLLGGVLKGQELITSARVRNLISQQDGIKAAFYGFQDRYRALPGDYAQASTNIPNVSVNGNGNGRIEADNGDGVHEDILVWDHLSHAGFINGTYVYDADGPKDTTNPKNPYGIYMQLVYDGVYGTGSGGQNGTPSTARHNLKTGGQIPVALLAEVDRKIDDGNALQGSFQFSLYAGNGTAPTPADCYDNESGVWLATGNATNCGGASLF